jgi:hypothetical protein
VNWQAIAPWVAPVATGFVLFLFGKALPGLIVTAIDGKFSEFRNEEVGRMVTHNDNENSHPRLRVLSEFEERMEKAFDEFRDRLNDLGKQIEELRRDLTKPTSSIQKRKR